jgi:hypothetical protein
VRIESVELTPSDPEEAMIQARMTVATDDNQVSASVAALWTFAPADQRARQP